MYLGIMWYNVSIPTYTFTGCLKCIKAAEYLKVTVLLITPLSAINNGIQLLLVLTRKVMYCIIVRQ